MKFSESSTEFIDALESGGSIHEPLTMETVRFDEPASPTTIYYYRGIYNDFIELIGDIDLDEVDSAVCDRFYNHPKYTVSSSKKTLLSVMSSLFSTQESLGRIDSNPWKDFRKKMRQGGRSKTNDTYYIYSDSAQRLIQYALDKKPEIGCAIAIQIGGGARESEVIGNKWRVGDVPKSLPGILIEDALSILDESNLIVHGKGNKSRRIPIIQSFLGDTYNTLIEKLDERIKIRASQEESKDDEKKDPRLIPYTGTYYNQCIKMFQKRTGIKVVAKETDEPTDIELTSHKLRHTFGMTYIREGGNINVLKRIMGHTSIKTTERYAQADRQAEEDDLRRIEGK